MKNVTNFIDNISVKALGFTTIMRGGKTFYRFYLGLLWFLLVTWS